MSYTDGGRAPHTVAVVLGLTLAANGFGVSFTDPDIHGPVPPIQCLSDATEVVQTEPTEAATAEDLAPRDVSAEELAAWATRMGGGDASHMLDI
jgi:hypothetical protein